MAEFEPNLPKVETERIGEVFIIFPVHLDSFIAFDLRPSMESSTRARYFGMTDVFSSEQLERIRASWQRKEMNEFRYWQKLIKAEVVGKLNKARPEIERPANEVLIWYDFPLEDLFRTAAWSRVAAKATSLIDPKSVRLMFNDLSFAEGRYKRSYHQGEQKAA